MKKDTKYTLATAAAYLVAGYKQAIDAYRADAISCKVGISDDSPESFEALWSQYQQGLITVNTAHSDTAVYGRDGNATFRIFHDLGHILYLKKFTLVDEVELARRQWYDVLPFIPAEWRDVCKVVYHGDTVAQSEYEAIHGSFPYDQRAFVGAILETWLASK